MAKVAPLGFATVVGATVLTALSCSVIMEYDDVPEGTGSGGSTAACTTDGDCVAPNPCLEGSCVAGQCEQEPVADGEPCQLGQGTGTCQGGTCEIECTADNYQTVCNDEEECTADTCNINTATCTNEPVADQELPEETQTDGDCQIRLCAGGTDQTVVDDTDLPVDGNDCTSDVCTAGVPSNPNLPEGTPCGTSDELYCSAAGICVGCNTPSDCDGTDTTCRSRTCINEQCGVEDAPYGTSCNDGTFCNGNDSCQSGSCSQHAGNPCDGPDGDGDCSETCRESQDDCNGTDSNGSICNDGTYCNGLDACSSGSCSQHGGSPCPGADGDGDCSETCNESADNCSSNDPNGSSCNDGAYCNGSDTCSSGSCSQHAGNPCDGADGDSDCTESCNESANNCNGADPNGSACTDNTFCNGSDTCSGGSCSTHAGNPCSGHNGGPDCDDSCDEGANNCTANDSNGTNCSDGLYCTVTDECSNGSCTGSGDPCPGPDGDGDCSESCNESGNNCNGNDPNGSSCNDSLFCTGMDTCSGGSCVGAGNPCSGHNIGPWCDDSCDESNNDCNGDDAPGTLCPGGICLAGWCDNF